MTGAEISNTSYLLQFVLLFVSSAIAVGILTPIFRKIAIKLEIMDIPNSNHKTHREPTPYLGGVAIMIGLSLVIIVATLFFDPPSMMLVFAVLGPALLLGIVGLIDDIHNLSPRPRFIAQTCVGVAVATLLIQTKTVGSPTGSRVIDVLISIFFIVGLSNSINFFDNVDGGASGTVAISSFTLSCLAFQSGQIYIAAISCVMAGSTIGFLGWNRSPARIYMGDAGSLFLGCLIASILVRFEPNPISHNSSFFVPIFLVAVPILDTCVVVTSRIFRGISPFQGGKDHLSHRLIRTGQTRAKAVILLWSLTATFSFIATLLSLVKYDFERIVVIFCILLWIFLFIWFLRKPEKD
jgi:UDP-GlcNAc:undecaprenyl-phosphate GlcNAc-1-phosphate transferase